MRMKLAQFWWKLQLFWNQAIMKSTIARLLTILFGTKPEKRCFFYDEKQLFWNQANENGRIHNMQQTLFGTNWQTRDFSVEKRKLHGK